MAQRKTKDRLRPADDPMTDEERELNLILTEHVRQCLLEADPSLLAEEARHAPLTRKIDRPCRRKGEWEIAVRSSQALTAMEKLLLYTLATHMNGTPDGSKGWSCHPSRPLIAREIGRSEGMVWEYQKAVAAKGFLTWRGGGGVRPSGDGIPNQFEPLLPPRSVAWQVAAAYAKARGTRRSTDRFEVGTRRSTDRFDGGNPSVRPEEPVGTSGGTRRPTDDYPAIDPSIDPATKPAVDGFAEIVKAFGGDPTRPVTTDKGKNAMNEGVALTARRLGDEWTVGQLVSEVTGQRLPDDLDPVEHHDRLIGLVAHRLRGIDRPSPAARNRQSREREEADADARRQGAAQASTVEGEEAARRAREEIWRTLGRARKDTA